MIAIVDLACCRLDGDIAQCFLPPKTTMADFSCHSSVVKMTRIKSHWLSKFCYVVPPFIVTGSLLVTDCARATDLAIPWIWLACSLRSQN